MKKLIIISIFSLFIFLCIDKNEWFFNKNGYYPHGNTPPVRYEVVEKFENGSNKFVKEYRNDKLYSHVEYYDNGIEKIRKNYIVVYNGYKPMLGILIKNYKSGKNKLRVLRNGFSFDGETFNGDGWEERYENGKIKSWGFHEGTQHFFNEDGSDNKNGVIPF